jgi:hypothetical protein
MHGLSTTKRSVVHDYIKSIWGALQPGRWIVSDLTCQWWWENLLDVYGQIPTCREQYQFGISEWKWCSIRHMHTERIDTYQNPAQVYAHPHLTQPYHNYLFFFDCYCCVHMPI